MTSIPTIYRKELVDTLRDRKTLLFMLLLPTLIVPLLMFGMGRFMLNFVKQQALEQVVIAADEESRQRYYTMAHEHFLRSEVAGLLRMSTIPMLRSVDNPQLRQALEAIPEEIFTDAEAYARWAATLTDKAESFLADGGMEKAAGSAQAKTASGMEGLVTPEMTRALENFYMTTIRDVGLVRFVEPADLEPHPPLTIPLPEPLREMEKGTAIASGLNRRFIHGYLTIPANFDQIAREQNLSTEVRFYYDSTITTSDEASRRVRRVIENYRSQIVEARVARLGMESNFLRPVTMAGGTNVATSSEIAVAAVGGILPYLVILFAYLGGIYPAVDLGAGEKERNTLETLLLSPVSRGQIAIGKFLVILTTALCASALGVCSLGFSFWVLAPPELMEHLNIEVKPANLLALMFLTIPPAAVFASVFLAVSIYARSFKEAQNYMTPLGLILFLPVVTAMLPGVELNWKLAMIPLVNVSLLMKELLKSGIPWGYYAVTFLSTALLAAASVSFCIWMFKREEVLFRS